MTESGDEISGRQGGIPESVSELIDETVPTWFVAPVVILEIAATDFALVSLLWLVFLTPREPQAVHLILSSSVVVFGGVAAYCHAVMRRHMRLRSLLRKAARRSIPLRGVRDTQRLLRGEPKVRCLIWPGSYSAPLASAEEAVRALDES